MRETQVKYYYIRNKQNEPVITFCLMNIYGEVARGVAICSTQDAPCKKKGRKIAEDRALWAFNHKKNSCPHKRVTPFDPFLRVEYKAAYMPELTTRERKILFNNSLLYRRF